MSPTPSNVGDETLSGITNRLPRLLYIGDVPVESSYHGSALLFRLLQNYPHEKLVIMEGDLSASLPDRCLPDVRYTVLPVGCERLLRIRFAVWYSSWLTLTASARARRVHSLLAGFAPDAVLTVAHGYSWITAARFASFRGKPLHLICHDDWPRLANVIGPVKSRVAVAFGSIYRQAASRLCVSPFMCDSYRQRYGVEGEVLLPSRAADCPVHHEPPSRLKESGRGLTIAFGGTINSAGYVRALKTVAEILETMGGRLLIFGPLTAEQARRDGLEQRNVELRGLVSPGVLMRHFREEADVLFVPMSFDPKDRANMELSFPSKLADYTAVGVRLLIYGPTYCSAVRWARANSGVAEVEDEENHHRLREAVHRLAAQPGHRVALGTRALELGKGHFGSQVAQSVLHRALIRGLLSERPTPSCAEPPSH